MATAVTNGTSISAPTLVKFTISEGSLKEWGCPSCGFESGEIHTKGQKTRLWKCGNEWCEKFCFVLNKGVTCSTISLNPEFPELSEHPRVGIPKSRTPYRDIDGLSVEELRGELRRMRERLEGVLAASEQHNSDLTKAELTLYSLRGYLDDLETKGISWWPFVSRAEVIADIKAILDNKK